MKHDTPNAGLARGAGMTLRPVDRLPREASRRGIATIWAVFTVILMFAFVALAVDVGWAVFVGHQLGAGADAASLAGAMEVRRSRSEARTQAVNLAAANSAAGDAIALSSNDGNAANGDIVIGRYRRANRTFTPTNSGLPNAVHVTARRTDGSSGGAAPTIFGSAFGLDTFNIERRAIAMIGGDVGPGVIALNPNAPCALEIQGNSDFFIYNGAVFINSDHDTAVCNTGGSGELIADELFITGGAESGFATAMDYDGEIYEGVDPTPDPLAALPEPNPPSIRRSLNGGGGGGKGKKGGGGGTTTLQPGLYASMDFKPGHYVLEPGLYYVEGELKISGNVRVDGSAGVMFFIGPNGSVDMRGQGNGWLTLNALDPLNYPNGPSIPADLLDSRVTVFQSRSNSNTMTYRGNNNWQVAGTLYAPAAQMNVGGTPDTFSNGLIADRFYVFGNGAIVVDYDDRFPKVPRFVFLIE